jgi:myo-inositol-1-phosphate synthase
MTSHLDSFTVQSPNYSEKDGISRALYNYQSTKVVGSNVYPTEEKFVFETDRGIPKVGVMLIGWGGNNGSTMTAGILAAQLLPNRCTLASQSLRNR